jgi:hypothetical protein
MAITQASPVTQTGTLMYMAMLLLDISIRVPHLV